MAVGKRKVGNPNYVKGLSGNPNGRPKGKMNPITMKFLKLKEMAAERVDEAFTMLWNAMEKGESWAHQIYFKELYTLPKNFDEKRIVIDSETKDVEGQIKVLSESLSEFDEVTQGETLERLKVLNSIKNNEALNQQNEEIRETRESLLEKVELIQQIVDLKEKELNE